MGLALGIISLGLLASAPIQGALLGTDQANYVWIKPIAYSGVSFFGSHRYILHHQLILSFFLDYSP